MSKGKKGVDGIDKVIDLFPAGSHKMIERLLARAAEREAKQAGRNVEAAMRALSGRGGRPGTLVGGLASNLAKALRQRGDVGGGKLSIRQKAPDTGGRPFHFAHSVISKEDAAPGASGKAATGVRDATPATGGATGFGKTGRAAAHMRYIEREIAVERTYGQGHEEVGRETGGPVAEREGGRDRAEGRDGPGVEAQVQATSATAGQGYIENPIKLANGEQVVFSFGTIGDRFEDRVRFWEALEEAEAHPSARVQHRLIVELPHEASPQARHEVMRTFAKRFEDDGVPYWAALHAPGKGNDSRNFHAHIVYSERPAKRMVDPDAPDAPAQWDFAITKTYRKKSRNVVTTRPYRQEKLRSYHARDFIPKIRKEFSETVNAVLVRDDVRDGKGQKVLYDARSYKSMGVDAVPMRSINRIVADKMKDGQLTVLDGDYTRRMITAEIRDAVAKRQKGVMDLIALDNVLRATAAAARPQENNAKLPKELRISPWASPGKAALRAASRKILEARHAALQIDVMERATTASLERIVAATAPKAVEAAARARDPVRKAEAASPDAARLLHAAALDELDETKASTAKAKRSMAYRVGNAVNEWKALVQAKSPEISPAVKAAIQQMDRREEQAERAARAAQETGARSECRTATRSAEQPQERPATRSAEGRATTSSATRSTTIREDATPIFRGASTPGASQGAGTKVGLASPRISDAVAGRLTGVGARPGTEPARPAVSRPMDALLTPGGAGAALGRDDEARASATAMGESTGLRLRPASLEDVLRVRMPPTVPELEAASHAVSDLIRLATEGEENADVRMAKLEAMVDAMKAGVRRRQGLPPLEGDALKPTSIRLEEAPAVERPGPSARVDAETALVAAVASAPVSAVAAFDASATSPIAAADGSGRIAMPPSDRIPGPPGLAARDGTTQPTGAGDSSTVSTKTKADVAKSAEAKVAGVLPDSTDKTEHPDDVRRRKKREEEIEKRKRQRQAVLARRNRGKGR